MKKLISLLLASSMLAVNAMAGATHFASSFLGSGYTWLQVTNGVTISNNNFGLGAGSTNIYALNVSSWTNVLTGGTNSLGNTIPGWGVPDVGYYSDALGQLNTNLILAVVLNNTNAQSLAPYQPLPLSWYNTNGSIIYGSVTNIATNSFGVVTTNITWYAPVPVGPITSTTNTNTITLVFAKKLFGNGGTPPGGGGGTYYDTNSADTFTATIIETGKPQIYFTNFPATFLQGCDGIALWTISTGTLVTNSTGALFNDIRLLGWAPTQ